MPVAPRARRARTPLALALALPVLLAACGDDPADPSIDPAGVAPCRSESLTFGFTGGASPIISWSPNCRLNGLNVVHQGPTTSGAVEWFIGGDGTLDGGFVSPVRYGVVPRGGRQLDAPRPLAAGTTYRVLVGYTPPQSEPWTFDAFSNSFTICGASSARCATDGMEYYASPSPEGLRFELVAARPSTARGDTARFVARVTNPGATTVAWQGCSAAFVVFQRPGLRLERALNPCTLGESISLAPSESRAYEVAVTGLVPMGPGRYACMPAGGWSVAFGTLLWSGGRRIGSAPAPWTLTERAPTDGTCVEA